MADIALSWDVQHSRADIAFRYGDVVTGNDLATAVLVSLFSARLANADDVIPDMSSDRRGWWADDQTTEEGKIGSRLWLLERAKEIEATLRAAEDYEREGLRWMISDGIAAEVDVFVEWTRPTLLGSLVTVRKPDGQLVTLDYAWAWQQLEQR